MKRFPILPTLVTLGNLVCGFVAIAYVLKAESNPEKFGMWIGLAGWLILFAMVFDSLDGKIARMSGNTSKFGAELDSLCDIVSFGVAPALIIKALATTQHFLPRLSWATSILFVICVALRLARFNVETDESEESHMYFKGLPAPAAAAFIAALTIMYYELRNVAGGAPEFRGVARALEPYMDSLLYVMPYVGVVLALLMISRVRYMHILNRLLRGREALDYIITLLLAVIVVVLTQPFSLPILFGVYIFGSLVVWLAEEIMAAMPVKKKSEHAARE